MSNILIGTSGYSFLDWVGPFYAAGTQQKDMLDQYVRNFQAVEINFSFYRIPTAKTMEGIARRTPPGYRIWVKANQAVTHEGNLSVTPAFRDGIAPVAAAGKLAGVLLQWPQRFHRTIENRKFLVRGMTTGISCIVDPAGRIKSSLGMGARGVILEDVALMPGLTPQARAGRLLYHLGAAILLLAGGYGLAGMARGSPAPKA